MKAQSQRGRLEAAVLVERADRVMREARKLLEQREVQLKNLEHFLEQNPKIAHGKRFSWLVD